MRFWGGWSNIPRPIIILYAKEKTTGFNIYLVATSAMLSEHRSNLLTNKDTILQKHFASE